MCEDLRAGAGGDLEHDRADRALGRQLEQPLRALWGEHGTVARCFDVLALWRACAAGVTGATRPCGHCQAEQAPDALIPQALAFFLEPLPRSHP